MESIKSLFPNSIDHLAMPLCILELDEGLLRRAMIKIKEEHFNDIIQLRPAWWEGHFFRRASKVRFSWFLNVACLVFYAKNLCVFLLDLMTSEILSRAFLSQLTGIWDFSTHHVNPRGPCLPLAALWGRWGCHISLQDEGIRLVCVIWQWFFIELKF